jgi:hypothetical protein
MQHQAQHALPSWRSREARKAIIHDDADTIFVRRHARRNRGETLWYVSAIMKAKVPGGGEKKAASPYVKSSQSKGIASLHLETSELALAVGEEEKSGGGRKM